MVVVVEVAGVGLAVGACRTLHPLQLCLQRSHPIKRAVGKRVPERHVFVCRFHTSRECLRGMCLYADFTPPAGVESKSIREQHQFLPRNEHRALELLSFRLCAFCTQGGVVLHLGTFCLQPTVAVTFWVRWGWACVCVCVCMRRSECRCVMCVGVGLEVVDQHRRKHALLRTPGRPPPPLSLSRAHAHSLTWRWSRWCWWTLGAARWWNEDGRILNSQHRIVVIAGL
jgi:hypothetical protein